MLYIVLDTLLGARVFRLFQYNVRSLLNIFEVLLLQMRTTFILNLRVKEHSVIIIHDEVNPLYGKTKLNKSVTF